MNDEQFCNPVCGLLSAGDETLIANFRKGGLTEAHASFIRNLPEMFRRYYKPPKVTHLRATCDAARECPACHKPVHVSEQTLRSVLFHVCPHCEAEFVVYENPNDPDDWTPRPTPTKDELVERGIDATIENTVQCPRCYGHVTVADPSANDNVCPACEEPIAPRPAPQAKDAEE